MRTRCLLLLAALIAPAFPSEAPRPSPAFKIERLEGGPLRLSQYKGKVVALAFISTGCPHCQALTQSLSTIAREYGLRGVQVLECAFNDDARQSLPEFLERFRPPFPVGWSNRVAVMAYLRHSIFNPRPLFVPHMVFLDRNGLIQGDYAGESDFFKQPNANIRAELEKLLKQQGRAAAKK